MDQKPDPLWYWDRYVAAENRYCMIKGSDPPDLEIKNLLLEVMLGNLLKFIEETLRKERVDE